ncbi:MAG: resolvase [Hyphomicrobium sp.]|nr:resolvase [Hyphomicrobium sp.]PPD09604.1 MAG: resolvase [Hyphomicrobium sp.]
MIRAAIYARYSSDLQRDASIEDQIRTCAERAKAHGWHVVQTYTDHALSGASMMRPGLQMLLQDAQDGRFDVVLAEALDRLSRDQADIATMYKRFQFASVQMHTLSEGEISNLHIGLKGTMNALFLKDLADKTRRGLRGRIEKGKSGGGVTYGYDVVRTVGEGGLVTTGERAINEDEAEIVRRIFKEYAAGRSPKQIVMRLNAEGVRGPSGQAWGPSTIYGNRERGTGLINNELYIGKMVWNRLRYIKDPDSGKRVSRMNPREQWIIKDVPELRIIDEELWQAVKERQGVYTKQDTNFWERRKPPYIFSYLIKCGECGGGCSMISQTHVGCSTARNKGTCSNRLSIKREALEEAVLGALRTHLMKTDLCEEFCKEYTAHINRSRLDHNASLARYEKEKARLEREKAKIIQSIKDGVPGVMVKDDAIRVQTRLEELEHILSSTTEAPILFHPNMAKRYQEQIQNLIGALTEEQYRSEAAELLRGLIDKIVLVPDAERKELGIDLCGDLAGILSLATGRSLPAGIGVPAANHGALLNRTRKAPDLAEHEIQQVKLVAGVRNWPDLRDENNQQEKVVAGAGFEPTTFRL